MADLYILDLTGRRVARLDTTTGALTDVVAGVKNVPDGIALDDERIYWTTMGTPDNRAATTEAERTWKQVSGSIRSAPLDGGEITDVLAPGSFTTGKQLTLEAGKLYWCDREGHGVWTAALDGSGLTRLIDTTGDYETPEEQWAVGVAVDPARRRLYWTQKGPSKGGRGRIFRTDLDQLDAVELLWEGLPEPIDLELADDGERLYWTDRGAAPNGNSLNTARVPEPGAPADAPTVLATGFAEAIGLAVDAADGVVYVSDLSGAIHAVTLDDRSVRTIVKDRGHFTGIALR